MKDTQVPVIDLDKLKGGDKTYLEILKEGHPHKGGLITLAAREVAAQRKCTEIEARQWIKETLGL
jgi:hypothetical protein